MSTLDQSRFRPGETVRLQALASFEILDTLAEKDLDDVVHLAAQMCATPFATITFVDETRQWFKARVGLALQQTPRDIAFCAHAIQLDDVLTVPDALQDSRFSDNPLVMGEPYLRFYAGFPLITSEGCAIGTLAVMDTVPRELSTHQLFALRVLARQVMKWLELRRSMARLHAVAEERNRAKEQLERAQEALKAQMADQGAALSRATMQHDKAERLYRILWETTPDTVLIIDAGSVVRFANPGSAAMFGYPPEELVGKPLSLLQPERYRIGHAEGMRRFLQTGVRRLDWRATEVTALRRDGTEVPVEISFSHLQMDDMTLFVGFFRDITARKQSELALFEQTERAQATLRSIADGVIVADESCRITFMNPLAERLTGWSNTDASGRPLVEVLDLVGPEGETPCLIGPLSGQAEASMPLSGGSLRLQRREAESLFIEGSIARLRDRTGRLAGHVVAFRDVSGPRKLAAQLSYQATHDSLTGLVNRTEFERRLQGLIEADEPDGAVHSLLYLDLDQFKVVNDTCGHVAGDELLKQLSNLLRAQLRSNDTLARLGGDEFGVLLETCAPDQATRIAEKLREAVAEFPFFWGELTFNVGVSIGHVCFRPATMTLADILSKADEACYMAKDLGRNRLHTYQPGDEELARRHGEMEWVGLIRKALKEERFVLYAQDIVDLRNEHAIRHVEILIRMLDQHGELVPPMSFLPAAERYGLMPGIDRWVIHAVCSHLRDRVEAGGTSLASWYAVNLSGASVTDASLAQYVRDELASSGVPGHCICFEITETAAIGSLSQAVKLMQDLKVLGCRFALDDFGSGMSSFSYLKRLPVDLLKIDGSFVRDIADDPVNRAMVAAIHEIGHMMGLQTVAEFVENDRILLELRKIGVDYGQGYGLSRPRPLN